MRFWLRCDGASAQLAEWYNSSHYNILRTIHLDIKPDTKYHLKVIAKGNLYQCFVDDKMVIEYEDSANLFVKGMMGLISCQANPAYENIRVTGNGFTKEMSMTLGGKSEVLILLPL